MVSVSHIEAIVHVQWNHVHIWWLENPRYVEIPQYDSGAVMYGGFQGGPQLGPHDAERRQSLGQLYT